MTLLMTRIMMAISNLAGILISDEKWAEILPEGSEVAASFGWIKSVVAAIELVLLPILIVVGAAGAIYAIVIGVNMARADSTEKREEAKKRLINVIIGIVIVIGLILFFGLFISVILPSFF